METEQPPVVLGAGVGVVLVAVGLAALPRRYALVTVGAGAVLGTVTAVACAPRDLRSEATQALATAAVFAAIAGIGTGAFILLGSTGPSVVFAVLGLVSGLQTAFVVVALAVTAAAFAIVARRITTGMVGRALTSPAFIGSVVGFVGGCAAIAVAGTLFRSPYALLAGLSGAVFGGVTAAALADPDFESAFVHAGVADVLSSVYVFVGFLPFVAVVDSEPAWLLTVPYYIPIGALVAIPVGAASLLIATGAGTLTFLGKRSHGPT